MIVGAALKSPVAERRLRDVGARDAAAVVLRPHVVAEEEELVTFDRPAQREAGLDIQRVGRGNNEKGFFAIVASVLPKLKSDPARLFVPDFSVTFVTAPPAAPNSAS